MLAELAVVAVDERRLERELTEARGKRDGLILDLLSTDVARREISGAAGLADISIYKIANRERARRGIVVSKPTKPEVVERIVTVEKLPDPVVEEMPVGSHPMMGWSLPVSA